jgi:glycine/D-amino acid oxidase-like deaminating enzyme
MLAGASSLEDPELVKQVLSDEKIDASYAETGHLALASSAEIWDRILSEASSRKNSAISIEALDLDSCEDLLKMRIAKNFFGGRWFPRGATIHSTRFVYGLAKASIGYGASISTQTRALAIKAIPGSNRLAISTTRGTVTTRHVVYACNAWASELLPDVRQVITPVRGQVLATEPLPAMFKVGLAVDWGTVYWRQTADGSIILGGNPRQEQETEIGCQELVNPRIQESLENFFPQAFPEFPDFKVRKRWAGIMDCSKDEKPIVGALPGRRNQWIVIGFNGHGMPLGLGVGKAVAEGISAGVMSPVLTPFSPGRFAELLPA